MPTYIHEYRQATFGVAGQQQRLYCGQHRGQAHTDVVNKACQTAGCPRRASFADGNSAVLKWCVCVCVCVYAFLRACVRSVCHQVRECARAGVHKFVPPLRNYRHASHPTTQTESRHAPHPHG